MVLEPFFDVCSSMSTYYHSTTFQYTEVGKHAKVAESFRLVCQLPSPSSTGVPGEHELNSLAKQRPITDINFCHTLSANPLISDGDLSSYQIVNHLSGFFSLFSTCQCEKVETRIAM